MRLGSTLSLIDDRQQEVIGDEVLALLDLDQDRCNLAVDVRFPCLLIPSL
jgi:hypothetical protein